MYNIIYIIGTNEDTDAVDGDSSNSSSKCVCKTFVAHVLFYIV